jgi:hypothetical protein
MPLTDTRKEPVEIAFMRAPTLIALVSNDVATLTLALSSPHVNVRRWLTMVLSPISPRADESDIHSVDSHPVDPTMTDTVIPAPPSCDPYTVTLTEPVAAMFPLRPTADRLRSIDRPSLKLDCRTPPVTVVRRVDPAG